MYRISELFTIIVEYPDSLPAIQDLKVCKGLHVLKTMCHYEATVTTCMFLPIYWKERGLHELNKRKTC